MSKNIAMKNRPLRSIFLLAAEYTFLRSLGGSFDAEGLCAYKYCCNNLNVIDQIVRERNAQCDCNPEIIFFTNLYKKDSDVYRFNGYNKWWSDKNGYHDYESRIYALLLCAEMLRK